MKDLRDFKKWLRELPGFAKMALFSLLVQAVVVIAMEGGILGAYLQQNPNVFNQANADKGIPIYFILFLGAQVFSLYLAFDAILRKNTFQIFGLVLFDASVFAWSIFQYFQVMNTQVPSKKSSKPISISDNPDGILDKVRPMLIIVSVVIGIFTVLWLYFAKRLVSYFGWEVYKKIGANVQLRKMYRSYQILLLLLKVDAFTFIGFAVQYILLILKSKDAEFGITIAAVPLTLLVLVLAVLGLRRENILIMWCFVFGMCSSIAYFIYKAIRIFSPDKQTVYRDVRGLLTFFAVVSLATALATVFQSIICMTHFGFGLRSRIRDMPKMPPQVSAKQPPVPGAPGDWKAQNDCGYNRLNSPPRLDLDI
ncbi:hypothetical protein H4219_003239 [Mycoemilia scoparia]|uniref:Uncharacterized protein n=1 Tax=Mycoemilia scoparia TaxID=417184 RepID=A0A9W8DTN5_9FUNG|nr:hypothetical protein H4219_003239 [Mycoemilia scoparia]